MKKKIVAEEIYSRIKSELRVGVRHNRFFVCAENNWCAILPGDLAIRIRSLYQEDEQRLINSSAIKEVQDRLLQDPYMQLHFADEESDNFVKLENGVFNVEAGKAELSKRDFSYCYNFSYIEESERKMPTFKRYIESVFPSETKEKERLLLQMIGYCLSDYTTAKAAFFFIGASNSGKSTILELIKRVVPEEFVTTIPLYRLENRFNLARLAESRINFCSELSESSFLAADIFKMLTSNETITAEHKGGKPFEFRVRCKLMNAGNFLPEIRQGDGSEALLNRIILLLFPVSIQKEKQNLKLLEKMYMERSSIFSSALDELVALRKENFVFVEPSDSAKIKSHVMNQSHALANFIREFCIYEEGAKVYLRDLYEAFKEYCEANLLDCEYTKTQFSQSLSHYSHITQKKMRIGRGKPLSGLQGIRLKNEKEYTMQDSEMDSKNLIPSGNSRNTGTLEQGDK